MIMRSIALVACLAVVVGCAARTSAEAGAQAGASTSRADRNTLRTADLNDAQKNLTALQAIRQIKPHFLAGSGAMTTTNRGLLVYMDDTRLGGVSTLGDIRMYEVIEIRYLSASEAASRYGTGHEGGALAIKRRK